MSNPIAWLVDRVSATGAGRRWLHWLGRHSWYAATGEDPEKVSSLLTDMERLNQVHVDLLEILRDKEGMVDLLAEHDNLRLCALSKCDHCLGVTHDIARLPDDWKCPMATGRRVPTTEVSRRAKTETDKS